MSDDMNNMSNDMTNFWEEHLREEKARKEGNANKIRNSITDIITWCEEKTANGEELTLEWDGGNDSGCFHLRLDGEELATDWDNKEDIANLLVNMCADEIDYGSFAGDYYTEGKLYYDRETKTFEGIDCYSTTEDDTFEDMNLEIKVPESLWFDRVSITINLGGDGDIDDTNASLEVDNGPLSDSHTAWEENTDKMVHTHVDNYLSGSSIAHDDIDGAYNDISINKADMLLKDGFYVHNIETLTYNKRTTEEKGISISLTEYFN